MNITIKPISQEGPFIPKGLQAEKDEVVFVVTDRRRSTFVLVDQYTGADGVHRKNAEQRQVGQGDNVRWVPSPFIWPSGQPYIRLKKKEDKDKIDFLRNGPRCVPAGHKGKVDVSAYYYREYNPEDDARVAISETASKVNAYQLIGQKIGTISSDGETASIVDKPLLAKVYAIITGVTKETSPTIALASILESVEKDPAKVIKALNDEGIDSEVAFLRLKELSAIRQGGAYVFITTEGGEEVRVGTKKDVLRILAGETNSEEEARMLDLMKSKL